MIKYFDQIIRIAGNVVTVRAKNVGYEELAVVSGHGGSSLAQVIELDGEEVSLQVYAGTQGISTGDRVRFLHRPIQVPFTDDLFGRVFDGAGRPRDGRTEVHANQIDVASPTVNPMRRRMPDQMVATGIPMIDVFNTLVESQKLPIFSIAGEPYNDLLARIALQADADIIVLGGMGLRHDDFLFFRDTIQEGGMIDRTIMFIHTASDPTVECLMVPDLCLAVGEKYALQGKKVLVLLTDMTAFCDALKEISIIMEQIPSNRGYPGDLYSQLARRYEKAVDFDDTGSMTVLACVTMPGDDVTHPIPDNTGYITEGQLYLRNGVIDPFGSLSRLKQQVNEDTRDDHRAIMNTCIQFYADCSETREKRDMGFSLSKWDEKLLKFGNEFEERIMDLSVEIPLFEALGRCWEILADCFKPDETGLRRKLVDEYWPGAVEKEEEQEREQDSRGEGDEKRED